MARNPAHILTASDVATVSANRVLLSNRMDQSVTLAFTTRQGEPRVYSGTVTALVGKRQGAESTEAVILTLEDGRQKSANLWAISAIS